MRDLSLLRFDIVPEDIRLRDEANQIVFLNHREAPNLFLQHHLSRFLNVCHGGDGENGTKGQWGNNKNKEMNIGVQLMEILFYLQRRKEKSDDSFGISNLAPFDHLQCLFQCNGFHIQYFVRIEILAARGKAGSQEDVNMFI